jgi:hypothetical protein
MQIYLDTEFTSLDKPRLISIGMVSEDGQEFYRELSDGWHLGECNLFVLAWVLPLLDAGRAGHKLFSKLDLHLDLIRYECDVDNQISESKEVALLENIQINSGLQDHQRFLINCGDPCGKWISRNPFTKRLASIKPADLLAGDQARPKEQVKQDVLEWLGRFQKVEICCDYDGDYKLLGELLDKTFDWRLIDNMAVKNPDWQMHHALSDARAMKIAYCDF